LLWCEIVAQEKTPTWDFGVLRGVMVLVQLLLRSPLRKALVIGSTVPVSVTKNSLRMVTIAMLAARVDPGYLTGRLHRDGGIVSSWSQTDNLQYWRTHNSMITPVVPTTLFSQLKAKIETHEAKIGVIGLGYVGLPLTLLYMDQGFLVTGFDIDQRKVDALTEGKSYIYRIPVEEIQEARAKGLVATSEFCQLAEMDAIIICVPTPLNDYQEPDTSFIVNTAHAIAPHLRAGQLVVLESTTYPGTTEELLVPILENENQNGLRAARRNGASEMAPEFYVAFSPEREDPGNTTVARRDIPKVVGGLDLQAAELAAGLYGAVFNRTVQVSSPAAAEMTKLLENIYRCVNIALVNELKLLCLRMGLDIWEVIDAAATKPFGFQPFYPGPGLGGHCIPIDPFYLSWKAKEWDFRTRFIELAGEINLGMPYHVVASVTTALNQRKKALNGARIMLLGVAYKKDIDDLRESPALTIIELLHKEGAEVTYNDPHIPSIGKGRKYDLQMKSLPLDRLQEYDCVLIVTDHSSYDYRRIVEESQLVVDSRNATRGIRSAKILHC
jgi:UDP-N-acetyl-D-glucosamine dehydrogenase